MRYTYNVGVMRTFAQKYYKQVIIAVTGLFIATVMTMTLGTSAASKNKSINTPKNAGSLGKVVVDTDVSAGINYGSGISNGEWVVSSIQGIELGLRATDRKEGLLDVVATNGGRTGMYQAYTGEDQNDGVAEWSYEWSVDLTGAKGNAAGKTISDYDLYLEQDFTEESLYGVLGSDPVVLPMPAVCDQDDQVDDLDKVCQQSWSPSFGNNDFDYEEPGTYSLRLVLAPKTFNGPQMAVAIQVNVTDPATE